MAITLRQLCDETSLGLRVLTGTDVLSRVVGWVHSTELADPTPFLDGGELVLTTGMAADAPEPYVRRLVEVGATGLGYGIGLGHDRVPDGLVAAAAGAGLPLLEVPRATPFIAISRVVSRAVAAEEYESVVRTERGQRVLTRAAVGRRSPASVVRALARLVGGWVLLLDGAGQCRHAWPSDAVRHESRVGAEVSRLRAGPRIAVTVGRLGDDELVVQSLHTRRPMYLAVGSPHPADAATRHLVTAGASLLSLALERHRDHELAGARLRDAIFGMLATGQDVPAVQVLSVLVGRAPRSPWVLHVVVGQDDVHRRAKAAVESEFEGDPDVLTAVHDGHLVVLAAHDHRVGEFIESLAVRGSGAGIGVSAPVSPKDVPRGYRHAKLAAAHARTGARHLVRFADYAGAGLLGMLAPDQARAFADGLLAPVRELDSPGADHVATLRCWLANNGHWDRAAAAMGVHRHTVRNRIGKVSSALGRNLDDPGLRAELWLALTVESE